MAPTFQFLSNQRKSPLSVFPLSVAFAFHSTFSIFNQFNGFAFNTQPNLFLYIHSPLSLSRRPTLDLVSSCSLSPTYDFLFLAKNVFVNRLFSLSVTFWTSSSNVGTNAELFGDLGPFDLVNLFVFLCIKQSSNFLGLFSFVYTCDALWWNICKMLFGCAFFLKIFKITNIKRICFLKLCLDGLENLRQN
jgi:hypothetical protein